MGNTRSEETEYGILFIFSLFSEYSLLEYVHVSVKHWRNQAEYAIRIPVARLDENVNTCSPWGFVFCPGGSAVWPQCWLCAVCAVGHVGCCVCGGAPCGGKHIGLTPGPGSSFGGEHKPFEWGWCAVGLCTPCLRWWGRLCRRWCAAGGRARAVLDWGGVSRGYTIIITLIASARASSSASGGW